jgi:hypothetical protein
VPQTPASTPRRVREGVASSSRSDQLKCCFGIQTRNSRAYVYQQKQRVGSCKFSSGASRGHADHSFSLRDHSDGLAVQVNHSETLSHATDYNPLPHETSYLSQLVRLSRKARIEIAQENLRSNPSPLLGSRIRSMLQLRASVARSSGVDVAL